MDASVIERLRRLIREMETRGPARTPSAGSLPPEQKPKFPAPPPSPCSVELPCPGVKVLTYVLESRTYRGLHPCAPGDVLSLFASETVLEQGAPSRDGSAVPDLLYLDIETTALGGAGTVPFLVGLGTWRDDEFVVRQFLLLDRSSESAMLTLIRSELESRCLVTFNGKCFDIPVLRDRFLLSSGEPFPAPMAHVDLYVLARRLGRRAGYGFSLTQCESRYLGVTRASDIPSRMVPALYFMYERSGDESLLIPVLNHNLLDVVGMASLSCAFLDLLLAGTLFPHDPEALFGAARIHARAGRYAMARACLEASEACPPSPLRRTSEFRHFWAEVLWKLGEREAASKTFHELLNSGLLRRERIARLSSYYEARGDIMKALEVVEQGLALVRAGTRDRQLEESLERRARRLKERLIRDGSVTAQRA